MLEAIAQPRGPGGRFKKSVPLPPAASAPSSEAAAKSAEPSAHGGAAVEGEAKAAEAPLDEEVEDFQDSDDGGRPAEEVLQSGGGGGGSGGGGGGGGFATPPRFGIDAADRIDFALSSALSRLTAGSPAPGPTSGPKDQAVHIQAARENDLARSAAVSTLSQSEIRYPLICETLRELCGAPSPASLGDFPSVVLDEAAGAFRRQLSGLAILHASAKAFSGGRHALIHPYFSERFDEKGADLLADGHCIVEADPLQLALGCPPLLQIALQLFLKHHAPTSVAQAEIVEIAKNVRLLKGSAFSPARGLDAFFGAHYTARAQKLQYDATAVYSHLISAVNAASGMSYEYCDPATDDVISWKPWATRTCREHRARVEGSSGRTTYSAADVRTLTDALRKFAEAFDREQSERETVAAFGHNSMVVAASRGGIDGESGLDEDDAEVSSAGSVAEPEEESLAPTAPAPRQPVVSWPHQRHEDDGPIIPDIAPPPPKERVQGG